ncbi:MAG: thiamine-phosphate kinase [Candidatus Aenigmarchaeota archaeon]|nr:thiamine-phosphate kinase [Candidatus Aenigmarchaeota archaeon]
MRKKFCIKDIGEVDLIKRISRDIKSKNALIGVGDDAAVINISGKYLLWTTDTLVENDHFSFKWFTPVQVGKKSMESNVSDIAAMGGIPKYALVSLCLRENTPVGFVDGLYRGICSVAKKYGFEIVGGNITHGSEISITVSMLGETSQENLRLRSGAKTGDFVCVTGHLGKSSAGLSLLIKEKKGYIKPYLEPKARLKEAQIISQFANAMIDVSDGLASEIRHICDMSKKGAVIFKEKIPISRHTTKAGKILGKDPIDFALYGGEDFELVFTISEKNLRKLKKQFKNFSVVGRILPRNRGIYMVSNGKKIKLGDGYDHFKSNINDSHK